MLRAALVAPSLWRHPMPVVAQAAAASSRAWWLLLQAVSAPLYGALSTLTRMLAWHATAIQMLPLLLLLLLLLL
jgi:hypothetical protein